MMCMAWVRKYYGVPAKRGLRVAYTYRGYRLGVITSATHGRINIRFDGETNTTMQFHPTFEIDYNPKKGS